jgi:hypothetical protein
VLVPGTQTPQDCVTDLKALPVQVLADGRCGAWYKGRMILVLKAHGLFGFDVFS